MRCRGAVTLSLLAGFLVGVMAGDFIEEMRRDFQMGLFGRQAVSDIQQFNPSSPLGGQTPAKIEFDQSDTQKPFKITNSRISEGQTFNDFSTASNRVCDDLKNDCADTANQNSNKIFSVSDCDKQRDDCITANKPTDEDSDFLYFCN
ncbi:hypothetical protein F4813DRAFT_388433 [Daldinia decipiens]|uniref:uncharacterized protein n=1 Tax=Daldinia decipiens TaxID=326647 RepID=UPI0020C54597|nr:uncharacterized protein F4813DRAFT_388433 [Daldinia decipiens]KAI1658667.1 hypothetical protein F4813DRAFT_388433 [Daldinia decipiens]